MPSYVPGSDLIFIFAELSFLILCIFFVFSRLPVFAWMAYLVAAVKFSLSAYFSFDMKNYRRAYESISSFTWEATNNMESGFVNIVFLFKSLHIPLEVLHGIEIIIYIISAQFLLSSFVSKNQAIILSLSLGFFSSLGELGTYLMRQLLSISFVYFSLGLMFRQQKWKSLIVYLISFSFHFSAIIYLPLFLTFVVKRKTYKLLILLVSFSLFLIAISSTEIGQTLVTIMTGEDSIITSKYEYYTGDYNRRTAFGIGPLTILLIIFFFGINIWYNGLLFRSKAFVFHAFTLVFTTFYVIVDQLEYSWLYSRINFIADTFLFISNLLLVAQVIPRREFPMLLSVAMTLLFLVSIRVILAGHDNNLLYRLPASSF